MSSSNNISADLIQFIQDAPWRWVKSTPEPGGMEPHQYVILNWQEVDTPTAWKFIDLIRRTGYRGRYTPPYNNREQRNWYLEVEPWVFWFIGPRQLCRTRIEYRQHERLERRRDEPALNPNVRARAGLPAQMTLELEEER